MREEIVKRYPDHGILGEEWGTVDAHAGRYRWVLDPIDGTAWFALGVPTFGTLVALLEEGEPVVGVIHFPALGESMFAARGSGCWYTVGSSEPARVHVRTADPLARATVSISGVHSTNLQPYPSRPAYALSSLVSAAGRMKFVGDCLQHALVARGMLHASIDTVMQPWDIAALVPCIREAGGVVSPLSGTDDGVVFGGSLLSSCDPTLHAEILRVLSPAGQARSAQLP